MIIAIDGPAASGKSTTAKLLARKLGFIHLNSGIMYRALTYILMKKNMINSINTISDNFFENLDLIFEGKNLDKVFFNKINIYEKLYSEDVSNNIKFISNNLFIRNKLIQIQRIIISNKNVVCEGRDIGSVVFPKAEFKFYLNADVNQRVDRRFEQLYKSDVSISKKQIKKNLISRDLNDIKRENSPLIKADDSIEIDTTDLTIKEQVDKIYKIIKE
tara:strand:- start:7 stop:657 length:651 start_codon:yes stop_codon:yes gene_type:complete